MIIKTSTGVLLHGTLAKDPEIRNAGQKQVLKFDIKAHSVKNAAGNWEGLYVQVNVWHGLEQWDGMLQKGDYVTVYARELKSREYLIRSSMQNPYSVYPVHHLRHQSVRCQGRFS